MKIKAKTVEECSTLFDIDISKETMSEAFEEVYAEISKAANIPGFRVGKAPLDLVKKHYIETAREEVLKRMIPKAYKLALKEHGITPIGLPEISDVAFGEGMTLSFKAKVDTHPKFRLKDYKGIKIEKRKVAIKDEDVEKMLESLREINAKYMPEESRPVQLGDYILGDVECFVDKKSIHKKRENIWLHIDKESVIPNLNEGLVGMKKDEERDVEVVLPEKYPDKAVAGKKATYHVKVKEIKLRKLPELNDEFAKDLGKENVEELRKTVAKELEERARINAEIETENQLLKRLIDDNPFAVPPNLVKKQIAYMIDDAKRRLEEKGFKREDLDKRDNELAQKFREDALRQVRLMFILDEIAKRESVEADAGDVDDAYKSIAAKTAQPVNKIKEHYEKEDMIDNLKEKIKEEKVINFLLEKAEITERK